MKPGYTISVQLDGNKTADLTVDEFVPADLTYGQHESGWRCFDPNTDKEYFVSEGGGVWLQPENREVGVVLAPRTDVPMMLDDQDLITALRELLGPADEEERHKRRLDLIAENVRLREGVADLTEKLSLIVEAGQLQVSAMESMRRTIGSILDIVDELCMGLAVGQMPDRPWAELVSKQLSEHRSTLGFHEPGGGPT